MQNDLNQNLPDWYHNTCKFVVACLLLCFNEIVRGVDGWVIALKM